MGRDDAGRHYRIPATVAVIVAAIAGATLLGPMAREARAQTNSPTAANGVWLPPRDFDPAAARNEAITESVAVAGTPAPANQPADGSTTAAPPEAATSDVVTDAPVNGNSVTTSLGGSDVAVSSVGGSHQVDRPGRRSDRDR